MAPSPRGALIVIEGLDRAGKTTQSERLCRRLEQRGHPVKHLRFPNRTTPIGVSINAYLRNETEIDDHAVHLLFSANRWESAGEIRCNVAAGITVVLDRYCYSGIAYSVAKGRADLTMKWAREPEVGLPQPDACVFLDIEPEELAKRGGFGEERYEQAETMRRVRAGFHELMQRENQETQVKMIDAGRGLDEVEDEVWKFVEDALGHIQGAVKMVQSWDRTGEKDK